MELSDGRRALVAGAKSGIVYAVDPDHQGKLLWQTRVGHGGTLGGVQWGSAADTKNVYVALSDVQRRAAPPGSPAGRDSVFGVPYELDPNAGGGLFALSLDTGKIVWHTPHPGCHKPGCSPAQSAAVTAIPGVIFSGGVDGHLRAYSAKDGKIIWDMDTERDYQTVNGVKGPWRIARRSWRGRGGGDCVRKFRILLSRKRFRQCIAGIFRGRQISAFVRQFDHSLA